MRSLFFVFLWVLAALVLTPSVRAQSGGTIIDALENDGFKAGQRSPGLPTGAGNPQKSTFTESASGTALEGVSGAPSPITSVPVSDDARRVQIIEKFIALATDPSGDSISALVRQLDSPVTKPAPRVRPPLPSKGVQSAPGIPQPPVTKEGSR